MSLVRSTLVVSAASTASRILGFARDVLFAQILGAGPVADAFLAAFRLPNNLIRRVLGEGGLNPGFGSGSRSAEARGARAFAGEAFAGLGLVPGRHSSVFDRTPRRTYRRCASPRGSPTTRPRSPWRRALMRLASPLIVGVTLASFVAALLNHHRRYAADGGRAARGQWGLVGALLVVRYGVSLAPAQQALWLAGACEPLRAFCSSRSSASRCAGRDAPFA